MAARTGATRTDSRGERENKGMPDDNCESKSRGHSTLNGPPATRTDAVPIRLGVLSEKVLLP